MGGTPKRSAWRGHVKLRPFATPGWLQATVKRAADHIHEGKKWA